jgi:hypothetical protein
MRRIVFIAVMMFAMATLAQDGSISTSLPRLALMDATQLLLFKQHPDLAILREIREDADDVLHLPPLSVTQNPYTPPSGDRHDYMSLAPYYWPNPHIANGLPYIRRDGERNPQVSKLPDHQHIFQMGERVHALSLAYFLTGHEPYAARATLLLYTWFLDPATKMNPNLDFAQAVLGSNNGRGEGVLEGRGLPEVCDSINLLAGSASWTRADQEGMTEWFTAYLTWLQHSKNGLDEAAAKNNHGSWFDMQIAAIAWFLGRDDLARQVVEAAKERRIARQIEADGKQPLELERTKSFAYCVFNLAALTQLAEVGDKVGVNLWTYRAPNGGSIEAAIDYLLPFINGRQDWSYENISGMQTDGMRLPLLLMALHDRRDMYVTAAKKMGGQRSVEMKMLEYQLAN